MAVSIKKNNSFPFQDLSIDNLDILSEKELIQFMVKDLNPNRRTIATRQIQIYLHKIMSHPSMRPIYVHKIKELIQFEKTMVKRYE